VPSTSRWLVLVVVFGGALFVAGYLSPAPGTGDPDDSDDGAPGVRAAAGAPAGAPSGAPSGARDTLGSPGAPPPP
ncbi:MAG: hypothetical protein ACRDY5_07770, partial [Acidimicrobiales bacterium]